MNVRHVFATPDLNTANAVIAAARSHGIADPNLHLVTAPSMEERSVPNRLQEADTDFKPAALRGAMFGALAGMVAALIVMVFNEVGNTHWLLLIGCAVGGSLVGIFASSLAGASVQDPIRRQFAARIDAGEVLVIIDAPKESLDAMSPVLAKVGGALLPYESTSAMS